MSAEDAKSLDQTAIHYFFDRTSLKLHINLTTTKEFRIRI